MGILDFGNSSLGNSNSRCPLNFALAAKKTRLQDFLLRTRWVSNFYFKAAALAVGASSCKNFALIF
ncbi:hypothetical protein [Campylobacter sp.]|uniref:hypothetical protein n=1 Tax=Campylobacter sp. TaxID=205 RepID=UPI002AA72505|nr:hypothetical protein [Campylobacter sp.]